MKFTFTVDMGEFEAYDDIEERILDGATDKIADYLMREVNLKWADPARDNLVRVIESKIDSYFKETDKDQIIGRVAAAVSVNLAQKIEKTKQYRALKDNLDIENDAAIRTGLRDMVAEIVKSEMRKTFGGR